jgi:hypothetical protein
MESTKPGASLFDLPRSLRWSVEEPANVDDESGENRKCILRDGHGTKLEIDMVRIEQSLYCCLHDQ